MKCHTKSYADKCLINLCSVANKICTDLPYLYFIVDPDHSVQHMADKNRQSYECQWNRKFTLLVMFDYSLKFVQDLRRVQFERIFKYHEQCKFARAFTRLLIYYMTGKREARVLSCINLHCNAIFLINWPPLSQSQLYYREYNILYHIRTLKKRTNLPCSDSALPCVLS